MAPLGEVSVLQREVITAVVHWVTVAGTTVVIGAMVVWMELAEEKVLVVVARVTVVQAVIVTKGVAETGEVGMGATVSRVEVGMRVVMYEEEVVTLPELVSVAQEVETVLVT